MYFSILNEGELMATGQNSLTKREALVDVLTFHTETMDNRADIKVVRDLIKTGEDQALEIMAASLGYEVDEHSDRYPEAGEDDDSEDEMESKAVEDLKEGDFVDLSSCPYLKDHPTAEFEYATVAAVVVGEPSGEFRNTVMVTYEGVDDVYYPLGTKVMVKVQDVW